MMHLVSSKTAHHCVCPYRPCAPLHFMKKHGDPRCSQKRMQVKSVNHVLGLTRQACPGSLLTSFCEEPLRAWDAN